MKAVIKQIVSTFRLILFTTLGFAFIYVPTGMCQLSFDYHAWSFNTRAAVAVWGMFFALCGLVVAYLRNKD